MIRAVPRLATLVVLGAVAVMIALGVWQLERRGEKADMLARYAAAASDPGIVAWPADEAKARALLYRRARLDCSEVKEISAIAGQSINGQSGLAITAQCVAQGGTAVLVALGWSQQPVIPEWTGGAVTGVIAPGPRLVADPPVAGLEANALPDPADIPDNHLAYAVQWFFFAVTALAIYAIALRKRLAGTRPER